MRIKIESTWLAAGGLESPGELSLNGQQLVDEVGFYRAAALEYFPRGGDSVALQFTVVRQFDTLREAEAFYLTHWGTLPRSGLVECICGIGADLQSVVLRDAVLEAVRLPSHRGVSVAVQYSIRGGAFETDVPPEEIPSVDPEDPIVMRRGKVAIASGATSVAVVFSSAFASTPIVTCNVSRPTGGDNLWAMLREETISTTGFTADLSGAAADGTYKLSYIAVV